MSSDAFVAYGIAGGPVEDYDWYGAEDVECTEDIDTFTGEAFDEVYEGVKQFNCVFVSIGDCDCPAKALVWVGEDSKYGLTDSKYGLTDSEYVYYVEWSQTKELNLLAMQHAKLKAGAQVHAAVEWIRVNHPRVYDYLAETPQAVYLRCGNDR